MLEEAATVSAAAGVMESPMVKASAEVATVPREIVLLAIGVMVGRPHIVRLKLMVVESPPALVTVSVMVVMPLAPCSGVSVTVRAAPAPPNAKFAVGTNV